MAKRKKPDIAQTALRIVEEATGSKLSDGDLPKSEPKVRNTEAKKKAASLGGKARASKLGVINLASI